MIIALTLVHPQEGTQGKEEEEAGARRKGGPTETPTPVRTLLQVQLGEGCRMRGIGGNKDGGVGLHYTGGAEGARDQSYLLTIEIEGVTER